MEGPGLERERAGGQPSAGVRVVPAGDHRPGRGRSRGTGQATGAPHRQAGDTAIFCPARVVGVVRGGAIPRVAPIALADRPEALPCACARARRDRAHGESGDRGTARAFRPCRRGEEKRVNLRPQLRTGDDGTCAVASR